jgi:hypothetical protein
LCKQEKPKAVKIVKKHASFEALKASKTKALDTDHGNKKHSEFEKFISTLRDHKSPPSKAK